MAGRIRVWGVMLIAVLFSVASFRLSTSCPNPYPSLRTGLTAPGAGLMEFGGLMLGWRRLTADIAWIQTLQYYGTPEGGQTEQEFENGIGQYPLFLEYCERVARIDPYFTYVYYYGAACLAWNMGRLNEAEQLLREGIAYNPKEWRLQQYLAAMAFEKNHDMANLTRFLEPLSMDPECPNLIRSILAHLYDKQHQPAKALKIWLVVYDTGDPAYLKKAQDEILRLGSKTPLLTGAQIKL